METSLQEKTLTCIICPIGCTLEVEEGGSPDILSVTGNSCQRGVAYALEEIRCPKRVVTATVQVMIKECAKDTYFVRRVPVKTSVPCPREKIPALLKDIYKAKVSLPVNVGDVVISNWNDEMIDVVATRRIS